MEKVGSQNTIDSGMNCKTSQSLLSKAHSFRDDKYREPGGCDEDEIKKALKHLAGCGICKDWFVNHICTGKMIGRFDGDLVVPYIHSQTHNLLKTKCPRSINDCPW